MNALGKVGAIAAAAVAVGSGLIYWAYKSYRKEQQQVIVEDQPQQQKEKEFDLEAEVAKFKLEIDSANPSFQDIKRIFGLLTRYIKSRTTSLTTELKAQRRRLFPKHSRFSRTAAYMRHTAVGLNRLQNTMAELQGQQAKVIASLGISQQKMAQFGAQLLPFIQEMMDTGLTLEQVQHHFRIKIEYLRANGEKLGQALELIMPELTADERQYIPIFMHTVISDQCFEGEPALDNDQFDIAAEKYSAQLGTEMMQLQQVIIPISQRLDAAMMALGEGAHKIPGYGDESTGMEMMVEKEQRMMEQLEAIRQHDPQAYEQLMAMMQSQMGR